MLITTTTQATRENGCTCGGCQANLVQLSWSDMSPILVTLHAWDVPTKTWVEWVFALDLLAQGLCTVAPQWAGIGDVSIQSFDMATAHIRFSPPAVGAVTIALPWDILSRFVGDCIGALTAEGEQKTLDLLIDMFLRELNLESF